MSNPAAIDRLDQLLGYLEADPANAGLLSDAAQAALDARKPDVARDLLGRFTPDRLADPAISATLGLAALQERDFASAEAIFEPLWSANPDDPGLAFNLAWARANQQDFAGGLEALGDEQARALPQAATLRIQMLHQLGSLDEAREGAEAYSELFSQSVPLNAAISVLAIDLEDVALARSCALKAGDHPDALTTLGTLALGDERASEAAALFDRVLIANPHAPRAWVGSGLAKLLTGQTAEAPAALDRGAEMFGDHLGSWIAAGWSHFIVGDRLTARTRFEHALQLDPNFAEAHGAVAVAELLDGNVEMARHECELAFRLDRQCFSAALARTLLANAEGDQEQARRIFERAITIPIDGDGRTIAQALATMGLG